MAEDMIGYGHLVEDALRSVVFNALSLVESNGLPGEHHFYITLSTTVDAVVLPDPLRAKYPNEMTIVLQHKFDDLHVNEEGFSVTLYFDSVANHLYIPFNAIKVFADPSVEFGLQFSPQADNQDLDTQALVSTLHNDEADNVASLPQSAGAPTAQASQESGEVIALDQFRKK